MTENEKADVLAELSAKGIDAKLDALLDQYADEMANDLSRLIQFATVEGEHLPDAPFGREIAEGLDHILSRAGSFGFDVENDNGYLGLIDHGPGDEASRIGALCHLDVVPAGANWEHEPFGGEIEKGIIYGRGAFDNKGPLIATLYAMRALRDANIDLTRGLRLIIGTNEESGFGCMEYFNKHHAAPRCSFVPDASFPLVYAEKGIVHLEIGLPLVEDSRFRGMELAELKGGMAMNVIPESAECFITCDKTEDGIIAELLENYEQKRRIRLIHEDGGMRLIATGKSAHGSLPDEGINAIAILLAFLRHLPLGHGVSDIARTLNMLCGEDTDGLALRIKSSDEHGALTMAPTMISLRKVATDGGAEADMIVLGLDIRFPVTKNQTWLKDKLRSILEPFGVILISWDGKEPLYVDPASPLVSLLLALYRRDTGDDSPPLAIGGGTYARAIPNAVAFGPVYPGQARLEHQAEECMASEQLLRLSKLYAKAFYALANYPW